MLRPPWNKTQYIRDSRLDLSTNVCFDLKNKKFDLDLGQYPDTFKCYQVLSEYHGLPIENLAIGYGLSELVLRIFQFLRNNNLSLTIGGNPTWEAVYAYRTVLGIRGGKDVLYLANPNGHTGKLLQEEEILNLAKDFGLLILDEAYADFCDVKIRSSNKILSLKTLSKSIALPGVRFGWAHCLDTNLINEIHNIRPGQVCVGGMDTHLKEMLEGIPEHILRMKECKNLIESNFECEETFANFVLFKRQEDVELFSKFFKLKSNRMALCSKELIEKFI